MIQQALSELSSKIRIRPRYDNFIGGKWVAPVKGQYFDEPHAGHRQAAVRDCPLDGRGHRAGARRRARGQGRLGQDGACRARHILNKIADRMEENLEMLALVETLDNGKPIRETMAADMPLAIDHFRYFAGCIRAQEGALSEIDDDTGRLSLPRAARRRRPDHPVELPDPDGGVEACPGARRRQLRRAEARRADADVASWCSWT